MVGICRRRTRHPSIRAATERLSKQPPFSAFHSTALSNYVQHGFKPVASRADGSRMACSNAMHAVLGLKRSSAKHCVSHELPSGGDENTEVTLRCDPDTEAALYVRVHGSSSIAWQKLEKGLPGVHVTVAAGSQGSGQHSLLPKCAISLVEHLSASGAGHPRFTR